MKRVLTVLAALALATPAFASKPRTPPHVADAAPATVTITGSPLTIVIGDETSMEVYDSAVPGSGQFFPEDCSAGETADSGIFAGVAGVIYGPEFNQHPCGSAAITNTPWTKVSFSAVTGTGTGADPFTVVIVVDAGTTGLRLTETITYVNGATRAGISLLWSNMGNAAVTWDSYIGADLFLADSDAGVPALVGGAAAGKDCTFQNYTILFENGTANDRYSANGYGTIWSEISAGSLSNTVATGCLDNGIANEWTARNLTPGTTTTISTGVSFTGQLAPLATVPTLSVTGLTALIALLGLVGYVLARKAFPGA